MYKFEMFQTQILTPCFLSYRNAGDGNYSILKGIVPVNVANVFLETRSLEYTYINILSEM